MRRLIKADGTVQDFEQPIPWADQGKLIGAATTDTVVLRHMGHPLHVMIVDDMGYETTTVHHANGAIELQPVAALKPVNVEATRLYHENCLPGTTHQIVGDVLVVPDHDYA